MTAATSMFYDAIRGNLYNNHYYKFGSMLSGRTQMQNTQNSLQSQIAYEQYLKEGNRRALADWHKNVPGRTIRYPELSYAGQIHRADTSIARAGFDYNTASANYYGNLPYRAAGLYGIFSRASRSL